MRRNFEIKVPIKNAEFIRLKTQGYVKKFKSHLHFAEEQRDIYYKVKDNRLKLRVINNDTGNLIFYERENKNGKRVSKYLIAETGNPRELDEILKKLFKVLVVVSKSREIFVADNVRIHLDRVEKLGDFLEFEIIFNNLANAKLKMKELIAFFELDEKEFVKVSYSDLLLKKQKKHAVKR